MTTPTFPTGRYGRRRSPSRTPRWVVPALVCLVVAATSTLAFAAYRRQNDQAQAAVRSYVVTATGVRLTIDVTKPRNESATCLLRARDSRGTVVGQTAVVVPVGPDRVTLTHTVPTHARAVGGEVLRCSVGKN